ncbi:MAG: class I SAM-dependent methyltransferase [Vicinamibacterales bacterium]
MADAVRSLSDLFALLGQRRVAEVAIPVEAPAKISADPSYATKALQKFLSCLQGRTKPVIVDLGPVVGANITFFGEQLGCRIRVEDVGTDIDRHTKDNTLDQLPAFFAKRFTEAPGSVDGILCWDFLDYLDRPTAQSLATSLTRLLRPGGCLLGFFSTTDSPALIYTKYVVVDESTLQYKTYPARRARHRGLLNGDIIKLFKDLKVTDSFLMKSNLREMLFRKPIPRV